MQTVLAAGMNNYPDHTEDYKVSTSIKSPASRTSFGYLNNPKDDPNGIFLTGNLNPAISSGVHTLQDVGAFGYGPGAEKLSGVIDNTEIFHIIASALGFGTNGAIDTDSHLFGDVVRCKTMGSSVIARRMPASTCALTNTTAQKLSCDRTLLCVV